MTTPPAPTVPASAAWCTLTGLNGRQVRTNSYDANPTGARFVTALAADGTTVVHHLSEHWGDPAHAQVAMAALWSAVADGRVTDPDYGTELTWNLGAGQVRACPEGTYVRLLDAHGDELDDGSAYWDFAEWVEDPELVMGAILGGASILET